MLQARRPRHNERSWPEESDFPDSATRQRMDVFPSPFLEVKWSANYRMKMKLFLNILILTVLVLTGIAFGKTVVAPSPSEKISFSRYKIIIDRKPFGEPPVVAKKPPPPSRPVKPVKSFLDDLTMCAVNDTALGINVGFIDKRNKKNYFLYVGEIEDGIELIDADYEAEKAHLRKGTEEGWIYMTGSAGGTAVSAKKVVTPLTSRRMSYKERLKRRREQLRHRKVEPPKMTGPELEQHLQEYNLKLIRAGGELGPPLPIQLTPEQDAQLVAEGVLPAME